MTVDLAFIAGGVVALYFGAEWLVRGAARIAGRFGVPPIVVGLTVVSFGTSAPELIVCVVAAVQGSGDIAIGNVLGSNMANIGLILGVTALVRPLTVASRVVSREVPIMVVVTLLVYPVVSDDLVGRRDGLILVGLLVLYLLFIFVTSKGESDLVLEEYEEFAREEGTLASAGAGRDIALVLVGCLLLAAGGRGLVQGASSIAAAMGIPEIVIGLTVVAIGTSLPELATSVVAAFRDEADIAVGNVIGSNIFNLTGVLGAAAVIEPIRVAARVPGTDLVGVLVLTVLVLPLAMTGLLIRRWEGAVLLGVYIALGAWIFAP